MLGQFSSAAAHRRSPFCPLLHRRRSVAIFVGPSVGAALTPLTAAIAALGSVGVCALYTLTLLPESLSPEAKASVRSCRWGA